MVGFCLMKGEVCCASTRLFLHERIYDRFMEKLVERAGGLRFGATLEPETQIGSLISPEQLQRVDRYVREAVSARARLVCGGEPYRGPPCDRGNHYRPTILEGARNDMKCAQEEIFGPVLVVIKYGNLEEATAMANDSCYALGATFWSNDPKKLFYASRKLDAGIVWLNTNVMFTAGE